MTITDARENYLQSIDLSLDRQVVNDNFFEQFSQVLSEYKDGTCPVKVNYLREEAQATLELGVQWRVTPADKLLHELKLLLGEDNVALRFK